MLNSIYKALAHPTRRDVLAMLRQSPRLAGELADAFDMSWPSLSRHLSVLKEADLISAERQGTKLLYRVNTSVVEDAAAALLALAGAQTSDPQPDTDEAIVDPETTSKETS